MATRGAEAARGGGSSNSTVGSARSRRHSLGQREEAAVAARGSPQFMIGTTGEAGICEIGMNTQDQLMNSKCIESDTTLQHLQSNCDGIESTGALEDEDYITKNRKPVGSTYCTQESREETPGREEARTEPPDGQQDPETEKNKEKTLGKEVLLLMQALNTLSTPEEKLAALCKKYADLNQPPKRKTLPVHSHSFLFM